MAKTCASSRVEPTSVPASSTATSLFGTVAVAPAPGGARAVLQHPGTWSSAFWTLVVMMRNVLLASAISWFATFWYTRGILTTALPPRQQSHATFSTAVVFWSYLFHSILNITMQAARLTRNRFLDSPGKRPTLRRCAWRIMRSSYLRLALTVAGTFGFATAYGHTSIPTRRLKLEYYVTSTASHYYFVVTEMVTRHIYQFETVAGNAKRLAQGDTSAALSVQHPRRRHHSARRTLRVFLQNLPSLVSICFAGGYVHVVSQFTFRTNAQVLWFIIGSMVLKLAVQEIAKHYVMKANVTDLRNMCIVVGVPTVLVNTQVRIVIMSMDNSQSTLYGTWLMATIEIILRLGKVILLRWQIKTRLEKATRIGTSAESRGTRSSARVGVVVAMDNSVGPTTIPKITPIDSSTRLADFSAWKTQVIALHTAEIYADMYAEYIAMGCSSALYFFCSDHPHYPLGLSSSHTVPTTTTATAQLSLVALQVAIEIVVDFVSCVVEILNGIDFKHVGGFGVFLGWLFTVCALLNTSMSAVMYIAPTVRST